MGGADGSVSELSLPWSVRELREAVKRDNAIRAREVGAVRFDLDAFCGGHEYQLAVAHDMSPWQHLECARQSGKTEICDGILLDNALTRNPGSTNLFLGLTGVAVRTMNWEPKWRRRLCDPAGVPDRCHNSTRMMTELPNRSRVLFAGTDDLTHVKTFLGNSLPGGVVVLDEGQDQKTDVLRYILEQLLPPMLTPTTRVILAGVLPDVEAGYFHDLALPADDPARKYFDLALPNGETARVSDVRGVKRNGWTLYEWGRAANVHTPGAMAAHDQYLRDRGLTWDDPQTARDWLMRRVWIKDALAYGYDRDRNGYTPTRAAWEDELLQKLQELGIPVQCLMAAVPMPGVDTFSVGIDPGQADRFPVEVWGWGKGCPVVQHVFDFTPPRDANLSWGKVARVLKYVSKHYPTGWCFYDAGTSRGPEIDNFARDTGFHVIAAAKKTDRKGQIRRVKNLFAERRAVVMIDSACEEDFRKARFGTDGRDWHPSWHPDPSEAARYALAPYFDTYKPEAPPKPAPTPYELAMARAAAEAKVQPRVGYHARAARGRGGSHWHG